MLTILEAQRRVDEARNRRAAAVRAPEARGAGGLAAAAVIQPTRAIIEVKSPGSSPSLTGPECLSEAIRAESFPSSFKEPRKVGNYELNMDLTSKLSSYEMEMSIRNATGNSCAKFMYLMMDGAAQAWMRNLPPRSINSWEQLKIAFIQKLSGNLQEIEYH